jgi:hypothetical protein
MARLARLVPADGARHVSPEGATRCTERLTRHGNLGDASQPLLKELGVPSGSEDVGSRPTIFHHPRRPIDNKIGLRALDCNAMAGAGVIPQNSANQRPRSNAF